MDSQPDKTSGPGTWIEGAPGCGDCHFVNRLLDGDLKVNHNHYSVAIALLNYAKFLDDMEISRDVDGVPMQIFLAKYAIEIGSYAKFITHSATFDPDKHYSAG